MTANVDPTVITRTVNRLDRWFETMRVDWPTPGYGGPVAHWWNHCLAYQGTGLDWRYEGIVSGYLTLWQRSGNVCWLEKARRAGDDLVAGQRPDGHFTNSRFELNPGQGGTPHEIACDVALLLLATVLKGIEDRTADIYLRAARRNLETFAFEQLWHEPSATFRDGKKGFTFVPNKAATFIEAVLLLQALTGTPDLIERYAIPTGERILSLQRRWGDIELGGAIAQNQIGERVVESFFPIYIARCVPALIQLAAQTGESRFREGAFAAAAFLDRVRALDGSFPMVVYPGGRRNQFPRWVAGVGDVVRAFDLTQEAGFASESAPTIDWMLRGVRSDGRVVTADGFGRLLPWVSRRERNVGELGVVGWCDKAFRALAAHTDPSTLVPTDPGTVSGQATRLVDLPGVVR